MPANRRFLCGGVLYTTFLCYGGRCTLTLLMFQVWTWIFSLSKKTDGRLSPLSPISVLQLCGSCLQICSLGSRGSQICSRYKHNQNFWDTTRTVTWVENWNGSQKAPRNGKVEFCIWFGIWAQGLYFPECRQQINTSKWIISMIKEKLRAGQW